MDIEEILDEIQSAALEAGRKAEEACVKSKYSVQDYWMCLEFWTQRLHDRIAKRHGLRRRCQQSEFRKALLAFKRSRKLDHNRGPSDFQRKR